MLPTFYGSRKFLKFSNEESVHVVGVGVESFGFRHRGIKTVLVNPANTMFSTNSSLNQKIVLSVSRIKINT